MVFTHRGDEDCDWHGIQGPQVIVVNGGFGHGGGGQE